MSKNEFLTILLGSQVDSNFIWVISQIWLFLQFEITQKKFHQKYFTITKPLLYLVLRVKKLTLPGKCAQTEQGSRKSDFLAFLKKIGLFHCFWRLETILNWWYLSKTRSRAFNEISTHLTSRKFTLDSKNVSFVHIWMNFQWFSLKRNFVTESIRRTPNRFCLSRHSTK